MPKFYTRYGKRVAVQLEFHFPSLTEQHHKDDCDINVILTRFMKTGVLPQATRSAVYGDFTASASDFREAMTLVVDARERFEALPSEIRERFGNDPAQLLEFLDNPDNRKEAEKLGLLKPTVTADGAPDARAGAAPVRVTGATEATPGGSETEADGHDSEGK